MISTEKTKLQTLAIIGFHRDGPNIVDEIFRSQKIRIIR